MKKAALTLALIALSIITLAQVPEYFSYQAIIRDGSSNDILTNQEVSFKMVIIKGSTSGTEVYTEYHTANTGDLGLVNIVIGNGTGKTGNLSSIDWGADSYFLKVMIDKTGGATYIDMGTTELLSVPYAMHSKTADKIPVYTTSQILALTPTQGDEVFNLTENIYQIFNGSSWLSFLSACWPQPTEANAGIDLNYTDGTTTTLLVANAPDTGHGTGLWTIENGEGGSLSDPTSPSSNFSGNECTSYILKWTISTSCNSSSDNVNVTFNRTPTTANAGSDQTITNGTTSTSLNANTPEAEHGTGEWTIVSGAGGNVAEVNNPTSDFSGNECSSYTLRWTISTSCSSSSDDVEIIFTLSPTTANAGADQTFTDGTVSTTLAANTPEAGHGSGEWSIIDGSGGSLSDANSPTSGFTGLLHEVYTLRWTISTNCSSSSDDIVIAFQQNGTGPTVSDYDGNIYNTIWIGNQLWMAENLATIHYSDGSEIPLVTGPWGDLGDDNTTKAYCWYANDESTYKDPYGALYTWAAAMNGASSSTTNPSNIQGVCPTGWHLPSDSEWKELEMYEGMSQSETDNTGLRGTNEGSKLAGQASLWYDNVLEADPEFATSGFMALPGGHRDHSGGGFYNFSYGGMWWSSTEMDSNIAWHRGLNYNKTTVDRGVYSYKSHGFSVRCVKD